MGKIIAYQIGFLFEPEYHFHVLPEIEIKRPKKEFKTKISQYHGKSTNITAKKNARTSLPNRYRKEQQP